MRMIEISVANDRSAHFLAVESADGDRFLGQLTGLAPVPDDLRLAAGMLLKLESDFSRWGFNRARGPRN